MVMRKTVVALGLAGILTGTALSGESMMGAIEKAHKEGYWSPLHHFGKLGVYGYSNFRSKVEMPDFVSKYDLYRPEKASTAPLKYKPKLDRIIKTWADKRFTHNPFNTFFVKFVVNYPIWNQILKEKGRRAELHYGDAKAVTFMRNNELFEAGATMAHELGHLACTNPYTVYNAKNQPVLVDEMAAHLAWYIFSKDIAGKNPRLRKILRENLNGLRTEPDNGSIAWREAERLAARYRRKYRVSSVEACVRLFNDFNNPDKFREIAKEYKRVKPELRR
ncbi:hypothetical protein KY328_02955 [Candidatus Woesearchaeota archaeon]|nr:hypothetical protein [Candidatus Woesearchaeota archaeon]MBW3021853.1 hypothetical protein [Candidatus Woesearchaeota archaeon]